ncbi:MAG: hypothetical protein K0Q63_3056 [Paenibacillus sp.]|nr:hypothetical protein [Paenibacillus sp.]
MDDQVKRDDDVYNNHELPTDNDRKYAPSNMGTPSNLYNPAGFNEEMGADFAYGMPAANADDRAGGTVGYIAQTESGGTALGWVSLVFAIASWFIWPVLIGAAATVLGFIAYRQGAKGLGAWSMALGLAALALNLIIVPIYFAMT